MIRAPINPHEEVTATVVDAAGYVVRVVRCPRHALPLQVGTGEEIVEGALPVGKRWDRVAREAVDAPVPPAPVGTGFEWDAARWRWVSWGERNAPMLRQIAALEARQMRAVRELALGRGAASARLALESIDDEIAALRAQLKP